MRFPDASRPVGCGSVDVMASSSHPNREKKSPGKKRQGKNSRLKHDSYTRRIRSPTGPSLPPNPLPGQGKKGKKIPSLGVVAHILHIYRRCCRIFWRLYLFFPFFPSKKKKKIPVLYKTDSGTTTDASPDVSLAFLPSVFSLTPRFFPASGRRRRTPWHPRHPLPKHPLAAAAFTAFNKYYIDIPQCAPGGAQRVARRHPKPLRAGNARALACPYASH